MQIRQSPPFRHVCHYVWSRDAGTKQRPDPGIVPVSAGFGPRRLVMHNTPDTAGDDDTRRVPDNLI